MESWSFSSAKATTQREKVRGPSRILEQRWNEASYSSADLSSYITVVWIGEVFSFEYVCIVFRHAVVRWRWRKTRWGKHVHRKKEKKREWKKRSLGSDALDLSSSVEDSIYRLAFSRQLIRAFQTSQDSSFVPSTRNRISEQSSLILLEWIKFCFMIYTDAMWRCLSFTLPAVVGD